MLCSVYTTIAGEYDGPGFCTPIGYLVRSEDFLYTQVDLV